METIVSHILYLDEEFDPVGTRVVRRPNILNPTSRADHKKIMAVGIGAFDDGDFDKVPRYWVPFDGDIKNFNNTTIGTRSAIVDEVSKFIQEKIRFISYNDVIRKIRSIFSMFGIVGIGPNQVALVCGGEEDKTVKLSLVGFDNPYTISGLLWSCKIYTEECAESIQIIRRKISSLRNRVQFIESQQRIIKRPGVRNIQIGEDATADTKQLNDWVYKPAKKLAVDELHELKKRMNDLERKRSWVQWFMNHYILGNVWHMNK